MLKKAVTAEVLMRSYISERGRKSLYTMKVRATSIFSIISREKTSLYPACTWIKTKICGWGLPAMVYTACRKIKTFPGLSQKAI